MTALRPFASNVGRIEPTSVPAALTMRESGSGAPPALEGESASRPARVGKPAPSRGSSPRSGGKPRSSNKIGQVDSPRSGGKVQGATSLASSTATVSWRNGAAEGAPERERKTALIAAAALIGMATLGAFAWSRGGHNEPEPSTPSATSPPAARRTFVLFIDASPTGAEIWEGEEKLGQAPIRISIDNEAARKEPRRLVVRRSGFQPYSIVQGPSDENVRIIAQLVAASGDTPATAAAAPAAPSMAKEHLASVPGPAPAKATKGAAPRAEPAISAAPPPTIPAAPAASTPPAAPSDIRLQR
jgi:serine/threonine-protein kinase